MIPMIIILTVSLITLEGIAQATNLTGSSSASEQVTCFDITLRNRGPRSKDYKWELGPCAPSDRNNWSTSDYTENCCVRNGTYLLSCETNDQYGWFSNIVLEVGRHQFCDDYRGYVAFRAINIPALTITNVGISPKEHSTLASSIPYPVTPNECPKNTKSKFARPYTFTRPNTCSCEDHCSWDLCRLTEAPNECIRGTNSHWQWDYLKNAWVAQINQGPRNTTSTTAGHDKTDVTIEHPPPFLTDIDKQKQVDCFCHAIESAKEILNWIMYICFAPIVLLYFAYSWKTNGDDARPYKRLFVRTLTIGCSILATYMTIKEVLSFLSNDDTTAIHYKRFNVSPKDKYPVFSICFTGSELHWYNAKSIFGAFELSPSKFEKLLRGQEVLRYDYNYTSMLYNKFPVDSSHFPNIDTEQLSLNISDILTGLEFATDHHTSSIRYGTGREGKLVENIPLYVSYNTPDKICFTRTSADLLYTQRVFDWMAFNASVFGHRRYLDVDLEIFLHHPQQLLRSFHKPIFKSKVGEKRQLLGNKQFWDKLLKIKISKVTILRKRSGSNLPCDEQLENDDGKLVRRMISIMNCIPPYWRQLEVVNLSHKTCSSVTDLQIAYGLIENYRRIMRSYMSPCNQMEILSKFDREEDNEWDDPGIIFLYDESDYQEMKNYKTFDFESFISAVGGFIGIFLGYSIIQIPDLLELLPSFQHNVTQRFKEGVCCKKILGAVRAQPVYVNGICENNVLDSKQTSNHDSHTDICSNDGQNDTKSWKAATQDIHPGAKTNGVGCSFTSTQKTELEMEQKLLSMKMEFLDRQCELETQIKALKDQIDSTLSRQSMNNGLNDQADRI